MLTACADGPGTPLMFRKTRILLEMIKVEHTVFALPFALLGAVMAARGAPELRVLGWILAAMVGARSAAMAFNRLVDAPFDARNPRTSSRALPRGLLGSGTVVLFVTASSLLFVIAAAMLNRLALLLSPFALALIFAYSYTKRFTWASHIVLGLSLACAPIGAWIAVSGSLSPHALLLGAAVVLWVAGLDIIYACQDVEFDRQSRLHSIPQRFGIARALFLSALLHLCTLALLGFSFWRQGIGWIGFAGLLVTGLLLAYEHSLVRPSDLSRVNTAFFTVNGWISILLFLAAGTDIVCRSVR